MYQSVPINDIQIGVGDILSIIKFIEEYRRVALAPLRYRYFSFLRS